MICKNCGSTLAVGAILCGECGAAVGSQPTATHGLTAVFGDTTVVDPSSRRWLPGLSAPIGRHTRPRPGQGDPDGTDAVMLVFSTGEAVVVSGHGLIGRRPTPDTGESVRHVLPVVDDSRSVSKTHLEFGFDDDGFWVADRWSANGSTMIAPGESVLHLEAGRRYRAVPGAIIGISAITIRVDKAFPSSPSGR